ncbi:MAG: hypothetical protein IT384_03420 [Deltaproteobacteria bacterium]|nr:hypothetical protein [Deltaproteobacteria bacterium]
MADGTENVTVQILREIRDELSRLRGDTNFRLEGLNGRLEELRSDTNARLDVLAQGQVRLATEMAGLRGEVVDLRGVVERNGERFEHFLATEGDIIRDLKTRMTRVEQHLGLGD